MKNPKTWLAVALALVATSAVFQQTRSFYEEREGRLELSNTRIYERLFVELLRSEINHELPNSTHTVNPSGGITGAAGIHGFTTTNDVFFEQSIPEEQLKRVVMNLSTNTEIANWRSMATEDNSSRFCRFLLLEKAGRPYIRMLMYESTEKNISEEDLVQVFSGNHLLTSN